MTKRMSVEECSEKARKFMEKNDGIANSIIVISSSDETTTYADDSIISDASVFDHSDENIKLETTRSITSSENDASAFSFNVDEVTKRDANLSGKRFERVTGVKDGRNGLIKISPVSFLTNCFTLLNTLNNGLLSSPIMNSALLIAKQKLFIHTKAWINFLPMKLSFMPTRS